jgi:hypothetical protein
MIIYGWKGSHLQSGQIKNVNCAHCQTSTSMVFSVFGKYAHIYWIPFFPYSKKTFVECQNCKKTFEEKDFTQELKTKFQRVREQNGSIRFPIWMFSGVLLIASIVGYSYIQDAIHDSKEEDYIKNPKVGDVYHMRLKNGHYSSIRVDKVSRDNLEVALNDYETDYSSDVDDIDVFSNYTKQKINIPTIRLFSLFKQDTIYNIERYE